jgi:hypothetical protein
MTLVENHTGGGPQVMLVDLSKQLKLASFRASAARHCAALGVDAVVWTNAEIGVVVRSLARGDRRKELKLNCPEPACLGVMSTGKNKYLLAAGTSEGWIHGWDLDLGSHKWSEQKFLEVQAHEGPVTSLAFQNAKRLASGGSDRSIALINCDPDSGSPGAIERRLVLWLRCKGMRVEGLQTEREREKLTKLIGESESQRL